MSVFCGYIYGSIFLGTDMRNWHDEIVNIRDYVQNNSNLVFLLNLFYFI